MDSDTLTIAGIVFLAACPIVSIALVVWARVFSNRSGAGSAERAARDYLDALQAQNFKRAAETVSATVLRDETQRQAWINKMEAGRARKRLLRYTLNRPRKHSSHDPFPGQVEVTVAAFERIGDKEYPAHLAVRVAIDKQSGQYRIVYSPEIYDETVTNQRLTANR
jgi:hypothetical protein